MAERYILNMKLFDMYGHEIEDFAPLLEEVLPALGYPLTPHVPRDLFLAGNDIDDAAKVLSMASIAGIRVSDRALEDIEEIAEMYERKGILEGFTGNIRYHINRIRALDAPAQ